MAALDAAYQTLSKQSGTIIWAPVLAAGLLGAMSYAVSALRWLQTPPLPLAQPDPQLLQTSPDGPWRPPLVAETGTKGHIAGTQPLPTAPPPPAPAPNPSPVISPTGGTVLPPAKG